MKKFSPILVLLAGVFWGTSGFFVKNLGFLGFDSFEIVFLRMLFASIAIAIFYLITDRKAFKIRLKDIWVFIGSGILGIFCCGLFLFIAQARASLATACILNYTMLIFVPIFAVIIFKEKLTPKKIIGLVVTFVGCVLCCYESGGKPLDFVTILIGTLSGFSYALYSIFSKIAINKKYSSETILVYSLIFACIGSCFVTPFDKLIVNVQQTSPYIWYVLGVALVSTVAPYCLFTVGLKNVENSTASILCSVEIVMSLILGLIFFSEIPSVLKIVGIILVIGSVVYVNLDTSKIKLLNKKKEINND